MKRYLLHLLATIPLVFAACDKNGDDPDNPGAVEIENTVVTINTDGTTSSGVPFEWIPGSSDSEFSLNYITYKVDYAKTQVIVSGANKDGLQNRLDGKASIPKSIIIDKITYPVTLIEQKAFYQCKELKSINIPGFVTEIGESAFHSCTNLTNVQLNYGLTIIGKHAFDSCEKLELIKVPSSLTTLSEYAFADCHSLELFSDELPSSIKYTLAEGVFMNCSSIKKITIPKDMQTIENSAFKGCSGLEEFTATNMSEIGDSVFDGCSNLKTVSINNYYGNGYRMGTAVFRNCSALESITITPSSSSSIYKDFGIQTAWFQGCNSLKNININKENPNYVESISSYGLDGCTSLEKLSIKRGAGTAAIRGCTSLKHLGCITDYYTDAVSFGNNAFENVVTENLYINYRFFYIYERYYKTHGWNLKAKTIYAYGLSNQYMNECKELFQADTVIDGESSDYYEQAFGYRY